MDIVNIMYSIILLCTVLFKFPFIKAFLLKI